MSASPQSPVLSTAEAEHYRGLSSAILPEVFQLEGDDAPVPTSSESLTSPDYRWPSTDSLKSSIDIEETIKDYASQVIRNERLTLPSKPIKSRYPPLPIDRDTLKSIIHRTHPITAEKDIPWEEMVKLMPVTPKTLDLDLEPILPAHLQREVIGWLNRVSLRLAAARPVVGKIGAQSLGRMGDGDVLSAIELDGDDGMTEAVETRMKGIYGKRPISASKTEARKARQKSLSDSKAKLDSLYQQYI